MIPKLPNNAMLVLSMLRTTGEQGYLVGGALRDLMLGKQPQDWDFATTLHPRHLLILFPGSRLIGGICGTVSVPFDGGSCEITPCRREGGYSDGRHPDEVSFVPDILADLSRRDFTVNAMAFDGQVLLDPFGGQQDIQRRVLRCVGNPAERFREDPLRVLRLFRLAGQLGFTAEWETFCAANAMMEELSRLPKERVLDEVRRILMSDGPQVLSGIIAKGGLRSYGFQFAPALQVLADVPRNYLCRMWALIALCGADTQTVAEAFGFSRRFTRQLQEATMLYRLGPALDKTALKQKLRKSELDYAPLAATFAAVSPAFSAEPALFASICVNREPYHVEDLAIDGHMLREEGIQGKKCGRMLEELLSAVIKNPSLNKVTVLIGLARGLKKLL